MELFIVRHQHSAESCPATDPYMGATLLNYLNRPNVRKHGIGIRGEAILRGEHTMYLIVEALDAARVREFMQPFAMAGSVDVFRWYPGTGHLQLLQRIAAHPDTAKGPFRSADLHVSADGRFLYVTNRESESNITTFSIDSNKGTLRTIGYTPVLGKEPRNFMIDPTGHWLLAANQNGKNVVIFKIDQQTGLLTATGKQLDIPAPVCLKMTPVK